MARESGKTIGAIILAVGALTFGIAPWVGILSRIDRFDEFLWGIYFPQWCWALSGSLAIATIVFCCRTHGNLPLKIAILFAAAIALMAAIVWGLVILAFSSGGIPGLGG